MSVPVVLYCLLQSATALHFWPLSDIFKSGYDNNHAHIVDSYYWNVLMRLGNPAVYNLFGQPKISWDELIGKLRHKAGNFFPTHPFELVDVSLLKDEPSERELIHLEWETFAKRPSWDRFLHWPTYGVEVSDFKSVCARRALSCPETMQPEHMTKAARLMLAADHWQWDTNHFEERVQALHALLTDTTGSRPKVIFFHGNHGCDRTGALFAAYALRYRNRSLTEAIAENELIDRQHMSYKHQVAAQWYCEYLVSRGLYTRDYDCGNCKPFRCYDSGEPWKYLNSENLGIIFFVLGFIVLLLSGLPKGAAILSTVLVGWVGKFRCEPAIMPTPSIDDTPPPPIRNLTTPPPLGNIWRTRSREEDYMPLSA